MQAMYRKQSGADQLRGYREADLHLCFRIYAKTRISHDEALFKTVMIMLYLCPIPEDKRKLRKNQNDSISKLGYYRIYGFF